MNYLDLAFLTVIVIQQVFWARQVQKLIDKLMSKDFIEYRQASEFKTFDKSEKKVPLEHTEDLGSLAGV